MFRSHNYLKFVPFEYSIYQCLRIGWFQKISIPIPWVASWNSEEEGGFIDWNSEDIGRGGGSLNWNSEGMGRISDLTSRREIQVYKSSPNCDYLLNKTLWERILGRRCIRHIRINISREFACTSVQGLMIGSTEYWDSLVCR